MSKRQLPPDRVSSYFRAESGVLAVITVTGLLYNIGLVAGPWFEGQMTEALARILLGEGSFSAMVSLAAGYIAVVAAVQGLRFLKRFYVRRFANKVNRRMKRVLYGALVRSDREDLEREGAGTVLTKAISDVDDCAEGMRKFTTEVFDTGVALAAYAGMLLWYDWRLALLSMAFLPGSYALAERMKRPVQRTGAAFKEQAGVLNAATMDRAVNALTYRVFGREEERRAAYEEHLTAYEHAAVKANLWTASLPPLYRVLSMIGAALILYFGGKNVLGTGWTVWSIAKFTTFLACFTKLATKSSKAAKLFNAVHKAQVSWKRIQPLMREIPAVPAVSAGRVERLEIRDLTIDNDEGAVAIDKVSFYIRGGEILGVAGIAGCGQKELCEAIAGLRPVRSGLMIHKGDNIVGLSPKAILEKGISMSFIPEDRLGMGLAPSMSITDNMILKNYSETKGPLVDRKAGRAAAEQVIEQLGVVTPSTETPVRRLSGGNVQKVLLGREIKAGPNVIVTAYPVRGLDINSSYAIYNILNQQKKDGVGILFVGEDLDVMLALCDKIMVLCHGKVMGVVHAHKTSKEELGLMMTGALDLTNKYEDKPAGIAKDTNISQEQLEQSKREEE